MVVFIKTSTAVTSVEESVNVPIHTLIVNEAKPQQVSAVAYGVFDIETGEFLLSQNSDQILPIASVTKLFTAVEAVESELIDETVIVNLLDVATEGRSGKLEVGQSYKLRELLFPLLLESSNDAATVFERTLGKISFADKILADGSGLSSQNTATVKELSQEVRRVYLDKPYVFDVTKLKQYVGKYTGWINNSPVRDLSGYQGGKHGYTKEANHTLVAIFKETSLGGRELGYVILGSDDLRSDTMELRATVAHSVHLE